MASYLSDLRNNALETIDAVSDTAPVSLSAVPA
jgi:hypothetical protein